MKTADQILKMWQQSEGERVETDEIGGVFYRTANEQSLVRLIHFAQAAQCCVDAEAIYRRAIELMDRDSHVGVALVDMSKAIERGGEHE